ncbi:MAG: hypothetical protein R3B06_06275 [Kofleriaceae bacterium]
MQRLCVGLAVGLGACGGAPPKQVVLLGPPPAAATVATLAGPLCDGQGCRCRDLDAPGDGGAGVPDGGKRFELRLGPSEHELWATVDDMVLYKSRARAEACFYVDLAPGDHRVGLRASNPGGVSAGLTVAEYAPAQQSWYATFGFDCGTPGVCSYDELDAYKASLEKFRRNIHDPCGSVKVNGLAWDTDVAPDTVHPGNLAVGLVLEVYGFEPKHPHGDPACAERY